MIDLRDKGWYVWSLSQGSWASCSWWRLWGIVLMSWIIFICLMKWSFAVVTCSLRLNFLDTALCLYCISAVRKWICRTFENLIYSFTVLSLDSSCFFFNPFSLLSSVLLLTVVCCFMVTGIGENWILARLSCILHSMWGKVHPFPQLVRPVYPLWTGWGFMFHCFNSINNLIKCDGRIRIFCRVLWSRMEDSESSGS